MTDKDKDQTTEEIKRSAQLPKDISRGAEESVRKVAEKNSELEQSRRDLGRRYEDDKKKSIREDGNADDWERTEARAREYIEKGDWEAQLPADTRAFIKASRAARALDDRWVVRSETWENRPSMTYIDDPTKEVLVAHGCTDDWLQGAARLVHETVYPAKDWLQEGLKKFYPEDDPAIPPMIQDERPVPTIKDGDVVAIVDEDPTDGHEGPWPDGKYRSEIVGLRVDEVVQLWDMRVTHDDCVSWVHIEQLYPWQKVSIENLLDVPAAQWHKEADTLRQIWRLLRNELSKGGRPKGSGKLSKVTSRDLKTAYELCQEEMPLYGWKDESTGRERQEATQLQVGMKLAEIPGVGRAWSPRSVRKVVERLAKQHGRSLEWPPDETWPDD